MNVQTDRANDILQKYTRPLEVYNGYGCTQARGMHCAACLLNRIKIVLKSLFVRW